MEYNRWSGMRGEASQIASLGGTDAAGTDSQEGAGPVEQKRQATERPGRFDCRGHAVAARTTVWGLPATLVREK